MRGTTAECLQHFLARVGDDKAEVLKDFVRLKGEHSTRTIQRWRSGKQLPTGEKLLRLRVFLEVVGYEVAEMRTGELEDSALRVLWLIGLGALEIQEVLNSLEYSHPSALFRILLAGGVPQTTPAYRLRMLARDTDGDLAAGLELWEKRVAPLRQLVGTTASEPPSLTPAKAKPTETAREQDCAEPPSQEKPQAAVPLPKQEVSQKPRVESGSDQHTGVVTHLVLALDAALRASSDVMGLVEELKDQVPTRRLRTIRGFLDQALSD